MPYGVSAPCPIYSITTRGGARRVVPSVNREGSKRGSLSQKLRARVVNVAKRRGRVARGLDTSLYYRCSSLLLSNVVDSINRYQYVIDGRSLSSSRSLNPPYIASFGVRPLGSTIQIYRARQQRSYRTRRQQVRSRQHVQLDLVAGHIKTIKDYLSRNASLGCHGMPRPPSQGPLIRLSVAWRLGTGAHFVLALQILFLTHYILLPKLPLYEPLHISP